MKKLVIIALILVYSVGFVWNTWEDMKHRAADNFRYCCVSVQVSDYAVVGPAILGGLAWPVNVSVHMLREAALNAELKEETQGETTK